MDPQYFQISLENWPDDLPEETRVEVDGKAFSCDVLFPDEFPGRVYCWGLAPARGKSINVRVLLFDGDEPVLEIPFTVPAPGGG